VSALVIDTSSWIAFFADGTGDTIIEPALEEGLVHLPPVVAAELLSGRMGERARSALEDFLNALPLCHSDVGHWFRVGRLRASLAVKGISISTPDAHVAQCALDLGAELLTADGIFEHAARHTKLSLLRL
jgi:predicted nucleic acid-binding protein